MAILLPNGKLWAPAGWVSRAFFDDCMEIADPDDLFSSFRKDIQEAVDFYSFTLSYQDITPDKLSALKKLVDVVIERNEELKGSNFNDPNWHPVYMEKLQELKNELIQVTTDTE